MKTHIHVKQYVRWTKDEDLQAGFETYNGTFEEFIAEQKNNNRNITIDYIFEESDKRFCCTFHNKGLNRKDFIYEAKVIH
jgi:hypothetical protein